MGTCRILVLAKSCSCWPLDFPFLPSHHSHIELIWSKKSTQISLIMHYINMISWFKQDIYLDLNRILKYYNRISFVTRLFTFYSDSFVTGNCAQKSSRPFQWPGLEHPSFSSLSGKSFWSDHALPWNVWHVIDQCCLVFFHGRLADIY